MQVLGHLMLGVETRNRVHPLLTGILDLPLLQVPLQLLHVLRRDQLGKDFSEFGVNRLETLD